MKDTQKAHTDTLCGTVFDTMIDWKTESTSTVTWSMLQELGFEPDWGAFSDIRPGLSFDFGNFKLFAGAVVGQSFYPVVLMSGTLKEQYKIGQVWFEIPRTIASREMLIAVLAHFLDKAAHNNVFEPKRKVDWIAEGRSYRHLLPWEVAMAVYKARPHCFVQRQWLRLALNSLAELLVQVDDTAAIEIGFDGSILNLRCSGKVIPLPAEGTAWNKWYTIPAGNMRGLPKRLMDEFLEVSVRADSLIIGRNVFRGASEKSE